MLDQTYDRIPDVSTVGKIVLGLLICLLIAGAAIAIGKYHRRKQEAEHSRLLARSDALDVKRRVDRHFGGGSLRNAYLLRFGTLIGGLDATLRPDYENEQRKYLEVASTLDRDMAQIILDPNAMNLTTAEYDDLRDEFTDIAKAADTLKQAYDEVEKDATKLAKDTSPDGLKRRGEKLEQELTRIGGSLRISETMHDMRQRLVELDRLQKRTDEVVTAIGSRPVDQSHEDLSACENEVKVLSDATKEVEKILAKLENPARVVMLEKDKVRDILAGLDPGVDTYEERAELSKIEIFDWQPYRPSTDRTPEATLANLDELVRHIRRVPENALKRDWGLKMMKRRRALEEACTSGLPLFG